MALAHTQTNLMKTEQQTGVVVEETKVVASNDDLPKQVIAYSVIPKIINYAEEGGIVNFNGEINISICFVDENNEVKQVASVETFKGSCSSFDMSELWLKPLLDYSCVMIAGEVLNVEYKIRVDVCGIKSVVIEQVEQTSEVVAKTENVEILNLKAHVKDSVNIVSTIKPNKPVDEILSARVEAEITSVEPDDNKVTVDGNAFVTVLGRSGEQLSSESFVVSFREDVACLDCSLKSVVNVNSYISGVELKINDDKEEDKSSLDLVANLALLISCAEPQEVVLVKDAFSIDDVTTATFEALNFDVLKDRVLNNQFLSGVINLEKYPEFDQIVAVNILAVEKSVDGINVGVNVVLNRGNNEIEAVNEHINLAIVSPVVCLRVENFHIHSGKEIEVNFEAVTAENVYDNRCLSYVSNLNIVEQKEEDVAGIKMYCVKENESLFDVCRELRVKPELVVSQNDNTDNLKAGDKVFVYLAEEASFAE